MKIINRPIWLIIKSSKVFLFIYFPWFNISFILIFLLFSLFSLMIKRYMTAYLQHIYLIVMGHFEHEQFLFSFSFIFWLYRDFVFFFFSFGWWRGTWHCSHMTCHMMWCYMPRRWWKDLEDNVRAHVYNMAILRQIWEKSMDIRARLIISSMDHEDFVYIGL